METTQRAMGGKLGPKMTAGERKTYLCSYFAKGGETRERRPGKKISSIVNSKKNRGVDWNRITLPELQDRGQKEGEPQLYVRKGRSQQTPARFKTGHSAYGQQKLAQGRKNSKGSNLGTKSW